MKSGNIRRKTKVTAAISLLLLAVLAIFAIGIGSVYLPPETVLQVLFGRVDSSDPSYIIVWNMRLSRVLASMFGGAALSLSGLLLQILFQNPIADPYILGISSGARLAVGMMLLGGVMVGFHVTNPWILFLGALSGALAVMALMLLFFRPGAQRDYPADRGNDDRIFLFGLSRAFGSFFGRQQHCRLYPLDDGKLRTDDLAENLCAGSGLLGAVCLVFSSGKKFERIAHGRGLCRDDGREHQGAEGCDYFDIRPFDCGSHRFCGPGVLYRDERTAYLPDDFKDRRFPGFNPVLYFMRRYFWRRV